MKKLFIMAMVTLLGFSFVGISTAVAWECEERSQGYWKNHPEAWGVTDIEIGGVTYLAGEARILMETPVNGDKWLTLFKQAVAATLNIQHGCPLPPEPPAVCADLTLCWPSDLPDSSIPDQICDPLEQANLWLALYGVDRPVAASTNAWQNSHGEDTYSCLDAYNNGAF